MQKYYIRFDEIPPDEKSKIYRGDAIIGEEQGVSVYDTVFYDGEWKIIYPNPSTNHTADDIDGFISDITGCGDLRAYIVIGDKVGIGSDGEPLIKNVKIVEDITEQFKYSEVNFDEESNSPPVLITEEEE